VYFRIGVLSASQGNPTYDTKQAIAVMHEKHGIVCDLMHGFKWDKWTGQITNSECRTSEFALRLPRVATVHRQ